MVLTNINLAHLYQDLTIPDFLDFDVKTLSMRESVDLNSLHEGK